MFYDVGEKGHLISWGPQGGRGHSPDKQVRMRQSEAEVLAVAVTDWNWVHGKGQEDWVGLGA